MHVIAAHPVHLFPSTRPHQAAVLHGKKEKGGLDPLTGQQRWKYTFGDIVYITDATSRIEVKSYHQVGGEGCTNPHQRAED